jgi:chorismate mutase
MPLDTFAQADDQSGAISALARCRDKIDEIDRRLVALLNERTCIVEEIGRVKKEAKLAIYEPKRESQVFDNITAHNHGPLSSDGVKRIFERIIDEMRRIQKDRMMNEQNVPGAKESTD